MQEALFYDKLPDGVVHCRLCPRLCTIREGKNGFCRVRRNAGGTLITENYGRVSSCALDPIEKKPLYHFYPGHYILSLGTLGCNLRCGFCQNWQIAHRDAPTEFLAPEEAVRAAERSGDARHPNVGIAYTYSEPLMWYEYVRDTARLARAAGLKNVLVTNGYIEEEPLRELLPLIDAMNVDVKGFTDEYYRGSCAGRLEPVLRTVELVHGHCHLELTTLLVTGLNDNPEDISRLVDWVAALDPAIPLHFSRYHPDFEFDRPATPLEVMDQAYQVAKAKLSYVYLGNVREANDTFCPSCGTRLIRREGYRTQVGNLKSGVCAGCGIKTDIVGEVRGD
ncbi:MAG TPA: AmmeMemoRadiSam system radical SAM enzyme [Spirochaetia bacterium]|nr:AmmeMemoRadiSam system radical SAM enzyme [Spirochaetia bacterium]